MKASVHSWSKEPLPISQPILLAGVVLLGFLLRVYVFTNFQVINSDGIRYITQAKAILNGDWELARNCGYGFISLYHLLIPVVYKISGDWIFSAKTVSLIFGTAAILPFYLLMRQLFRSSVALTGTLAFAVHPFFVSRSVELIKDPIFWFFSLLGLFFFVTAVRNKEKSSWLLFSSISFLLGGLARVEILIYFAGTILYILIFESSRFRKLLLFTLPIGFLLVVFGIADLFLFKKEYFGITYLSPRLRHFSHVLSGSTLNGDISHKILSGFSELISKTITAVSVSFLPFFLAGLLVARGEVKREKLFWYFSILVLLSLVTLFYFYLRTEILSPRYVVLAVLPGSAFMCLGIEKIYKLIQKKGFREKTAFVLICVYITASALGSYGRYQRTDKLIYKEIGEYVASAEQNRKTIIVSAESRVMFYANLHAVEIECGDHSSYYKVLPAMPYDEMTAFIRSQKAGYLLWEESLWKTAGYDLQSVAGTDALTHIEEWATDRGKLILFKVTD